MNNDINNINVEKINLATSWILKIAWHNLQMVNYAIHTARVDLNLDIKEHKEIFDEMNEFVEYTEKKLISIYEKNESKPFTGW